MATFAADCSRDDVDHYLDRGFTPQQVLELCRAATPQALPQEPEVVSRLRRQLADLMDVRELELTERSLNYVQDVCVKYDEPNFAQQQKKACGLAYLEIPRASLRVLDQKKKLLFWGQDAVLLEAPGLTRRYELGQEQLSQRNQTQLQRALPKDDQLAVPVKPGASTRRLAELLSSISQTKKTAP